MIKAYVAKNAGEKFEEFTYKPEQLGDKDVEINIESCGICHSDLSMWKNHWGITTYPFVGGHEISGVISQIGAKVTKFKIGDKVGLGWHKAYCNQCNLCLSGDHNLCKDQVGTIIDNYGGFAEKICAEETSVIKLPDNMDIKTAGPLLCGGITVFNPLIQFNIKPTNHIAVIGIGGLGHLALQFAKAWGCEVTAFTSEEKFNEAKEMGAHNVINSRDENEFSKYTGKFDLIISTVNVALNWELIISTLSAKGRLHFVGVVPEPIKIQAFPLIAGQISLSGSPVGAPATLNLMMEFAARHQIIPIIEKFKFSEINEAFAHLESGKARYRIVLSK